MSAVGEAKDDFASGAKPRPGGRVRERGRRATLGGSFGASITRRAP